jgi:MFS family permease
MSVDVSRPAAPVTAERVMPALMSACVAVVVAMVAAVNLALPKLSGSSLHPSSTQLLWIVDAYVLVFGCLLIPAGALGDRLGRKGILVSGMVVFAAGGVAAAAAHDVGTLVTGRVISGAGAALVMPATLSLLLQVTPPERKPRAIATWTGATGAAGALGTLGGGALLQVAPWQALFGVVAGLTLLLAVVVAWVAPPGQRTAASTDPLGTLLVTASVFALLLGIIESAGQGWGSALVLGSLAAAGLLLATFTWHALRAARPLLDPRVFAISGLRTGTLGVAAVFFGLFALFFVNAQYLQYAKGYPPVVTGGYPAAADRADRRQPAEHRAGPARRGPRGGHRRDDDDRGRPARPVVRGRGHALPAVWPRAAGHLRRGGAQRAEPVHRDHGLASARPGGDGLWPEQRQPRDRQRPRDRRRRHGPWQPLRRRPAGRAATVRGFGLRRARCRQAARRRRPRPHDRRVHQRHGGRLPGGRRRGLPRRGHRHGRTAQAPVNGGQMTQPSQSVISASRRSASVAGSTSVLVATPNRSISGTARATAAGRGGGRGRPGRAGLDLGQRRVGVGGDGGWGAGEQAPEGVPAVPAMTFSAWGSR